MAERKYDSNDDGEDWFNQNYSPRSYARLVPTVAAEGHEHSLRLPARENDSGVFARCTWAASIKDITDGTSKTIAMGEIRPRCSAFQWVHGWTLSEGLWFATTRADQLPDQSR